MKTLAAILAFAFTLSLVSSVKAVPSLIPQVTIEKDKRPPRWEKLGVRKVNYRLDRDEIPVTARDGAFTALKLKVRQGGINIHKMTIHFRNGDPQEVILRNKIPAGGETRVIDLKGNRRIITKVSFWYDTKNFAGRRASVELWGRH